AERRARPAGPGEAEQDRYGDGGAAPSLVQPDVAPAAAGLEPAAPRTPRRRLILWPIAAALAVGIGAGFLGGYGVGSRDRLEVPVYDVSPAIPSTPRAPATAATPAGKEFTESAVNEAPKPAAPAPSPAATAPPARASA